METGVGKVCIATGIDVGGDDSDDDDFDVCKCVCCTNF
jgi:hypothetical protein